MGVMILSTPGAHCTQLTDADSQYHNRVLHYYPLVPLVFIPCMFSMGSGRGPVVLCTFPFTEKKETQIRCNLKNKNKKAVPAK